MYNDHCEAPRSTGACLPLDLSSRHTLIFEFGTLGLEPRQTASEAVVLPLDDIPMKGTNNKLVAEDGVEPPIFGL